MHSIVKYLFILSLFGSTQLSCSNTAENNMQQLAAKPVVVQPVIVTDTLPHDTDDAAIWINPADASQSLVIGTDKNQDGGLYVFNLAGKVDTARSVTGLQRPNNVDVEYGLLLGGKRIDIVVATERLTSKLRIYSLPDMLPIDNGGIPVFEGETTPGYRDPMGIALYKNSEGDIYAIVGRKTGPANGTYLWQYLLSDDGKGKLTAKPVRKFGQYSGTLEIEAIAVDDRLGYIYYADEGTGVRKYYADPARGNEELALFATKGFAEDHEGISIYNSSDSTGFILVSDQLANQFQVFKREGNAGNPHQHSLVKVVKVAAMHSDGSEIVAIPLNAAFKKGLFVVMNDEKNFHFYTPEAVLGDSLLNK
ncbi:MAG: phytase [Rhizobacter sp.]|nr:phytase [Ferruginibacter sp.]